MKEHRDVLETVLYADSLVPDDSHLKLFDSSDKATEFKGQRLLPTFYCVTDTLQSTKQSVIPSNLDQAPEPAKEYAGSGNV